MANEIIQSWQQEKDPNALSPEGAARVEKVNREYKDAAIRLKQKMPQNQFDDFMRTNPTLEQVRGAHRTLNKDELDKINAKWKLRTGGRK